MRLTGSRAYYRSTPPKMPSGLVELLDGLTREVLRNNPTDIYGFCAGHMQQLLEIRDGPLRKKTLTLEEKIAKAQKKVRQRAEQRRQQYDKDLLNQQSGKSPGITPNKNDKSSTVPIQEPTAKGPQEPTAAVPDEATVSKESTATITQEPTGAVPKKPTAVVPQEHTAIIPQEPTAIVPQEPKSAIPQEPKVTIPQEPTAIVPKETKATIPKEPTAVIPQEPSAIVPQEPTDIVPQEPTAIVPKETKATISQEPTAVVPKEPEVTIPQEPIAIVPQQPTALVPREPTAIVPPTTTISLESSATVPINSKATDAVPQEPTPVIPQETAIVPKELTDAVVSQELKASVAHEPTATVSKEHTATVPQEHTEPAPQEPVGAFPHEPTATIIQEPKLTVPKVPTDKVSQEPTIAVSKVPTDTVPKAPKNTVPQEPTASVSMPIQNEQELVKSSSEKLSNELCAPSKDFQQEVLKEMAIKDFAAIKSDVETESNGHDHIKSKGNMVLAEECNKTNVPTQDLTLSELPKTDEFPAKVEILDNLSAPKVDGPIAAEKPPLNEDQAFVLEANALQKFDEGAPNSEQKLPNPIDTKDIINVSEPVRACEKTISILTETKNTSADNNLDDQKSLTQATNEITKEIVGSQSDNINLLINEDESQQLNDNATIQQFVESGVANVTNGSNIDNVELSSDDINGKDEDPQETNTFDISFKESPTVELQDPQINLDMLESLLESNSDSDIVTLITQESTNGELKQHNAFEHYTADSDFPEGKKDNLKTNGVSLTHDDLSAALAQHQTNGNDYIENNNKENAQIDNSDHEYISTLLGETPQIHNQDSNMDLETAAVTIQKVFRTFLFKSRASTFDDSGSDETIFLNEVDKNKEDCDFPIAGTLNKGRPHGITRMDTVLQTVNEEKSLSLSTDDSSTLSSAATVIQAHVRGFLVRNKLNSNKTISTNSLAATNSNEPSLTSLEMDNEQSKNKTVLNIHIVPEGGNYLSRDESLITSMDLSLDSSPPSSINLHPLGYDKSERRKQLKREDAIQSVSPPSNNSGKLSEDVDSVKELPLNDFETTEEHQAENNDVAKDDLHSTSVEEDKTGQVENVALGNIVADDLKPTEKVEEEKTSSDETDVVTPFKSKQDNNLSDQRLMHSGEFHDAVLPTKVSRSDTSVTSEFKNVLVYFLLWNHS